MIELDAKTLRQLQMIELEMLVEVDRICRKCGIRYNIIAGTMLGAIRHGGFIPWDDDADVAMLRDEYERFKECCKTELDSSRFYFQDHEETDGYRWGYGKLRRKGTLFLREHQEDMPYEQGVFIDVFPMDTIPKSYPLRAIHNFHCFCIRKTLWSRIGQISDKNPFARLCYRLLAHIPEKKIKASLNRLIKKSKKIKSPYVRMLMFPSPTKSFGYDRNWYEKPVDIRFENVTLKGIEDYDGYLKHCYGEYMELPPKDKRKVHPVSSIQLL